MNSYLRRCASIFHTNQSLEGDRDKSWRSLRVEVDEHAGFCAGVARAIALAEESLAAGQLLSIGPIIHNPLEVARLEKRGLHALPQEEVEGSDPGRLPARRVLVRSHGISEALRSRLESAGLELIDGTCPIVRKVQQLVKAYCTQGYRVMIFGKKDHPEVRGLVGHCPQGAVVVGSVEEAQQVAPSGEPTVLVAQTTAPGSVFAQVADALQQRIPSLKVHDTICRSVRRREKSIAAFAQAHDVLVFVGGKESSNSRQLFSICQQHNRRSFWIEGPEEVQADWFAAAGSVGVTGGASTPRWLLQQVADSIAHAARSDGHKNHIKEVVLNDERRINPGVRTGRRSQERNGRR